jgi:hypothetical protein
LQDLNHQEVQFLQRLSSKSTFQLLSTLEAISMSSSFAQLMTWKFLLALNCTLTATALMSPMRQLMTQYPYQ